MKTHEIGKKIKNNKEIKYEKRTKYDKEINFPAYCTSITVDYNKYD